VNGKEIVKKLKAAGFVVLRTEGSHDRLGHGAVKVSVPLHGAHDVKPGTLASIEKQSGVKLK
jgi:predicted RNA binding protein YcfA (HicA-like mRNA interferase family)